MIFQIMAPHFCAGGDINFGKVTNVPPILKYMRGWSEVRVIMYCTKKGWTYRTVEDHKQSGTESGRWSSNHPAPQTIPKE